MRDVITFMALMKEVSFIFYIRLPTPEVFCKVFEITEFALPLRKSDKFSLIKKHIAIKYHHFRSLVQKKLIGICYIDTIEKQQTFLLNYSTNHYSFILEESYMDV